jgi:3-oxoacyl-[acyl-carrier protein] reductase
MSSPSSIIITGAYSGLGKFLCHRFYQTFDHIIGLDKKQEIESLATDSPNFTGLCCDLTNEQEVEITINKVLGTNPIPNVLINNAGIIHNELLYNFLDKDKPKHSSTLWKNILDSNLTSAFLITREIVNHWINNRIKGKIINISSICAKGNIGQSAYSSAKAGIEAFTKTLSKELAPFGIRTNCIAPGFIDTESTRNSLGEQKLNQIIQQIPLRRLGESKEIFSAANFLIQNDYINGAIIPVDGGLSL